MNRFNPNSACRFLNRLCLLVFALCLAACGKSQPTETITDAKGRITFQLPDGWAEVAGSGGTRFKPPASLGSVQVQVTTVDRHPRHGAEAQRDSWLKFQRENGQKVIFEAVRDAKGFHIVEYAHTAENIMGSAVSHYTLMQKDDYIVAASLTTGPDSYEQFLPIYRQITKSIQAVEMAE